MKKQPWSVQSTGLLWVVMIGGGILFAVMAALQAGSLPAIDRMTEQAVALMRSPEGTSFFKGVTWLGETQWFVVLCVGMLALGRFRPKAVLFTINALLVGGLNQTLKWIFSRPRPPLSEQLMAVTGHSFPSGHAMAAMAIYGLVIYAVWRTRWSSRCKIGLTAALIMLIVLVGFSRVYLRVHYPTDVLGGFGASMGYLALFIFVTEWIERNRIENGGASA